MKTGSFQEKLLIAKLRMRDKEAFAQLYDNYIDRIYRFIYFKVSNKETAEDLTSQTFLKVWQYALDGNIKLGKSLQAFLYTAARNTVIDYYRQNKNKEISLDESEDISVENNIEQSIDQDLQVDEVSKKLKNLKNEYQEIIILYYINELSIKEIASVLNKKKGTIRVTLHRALKALRK